MILRAGLLGLVLLAGIAGCNREKAPVADAPPTAAVQSLLDERDILGVMDGLDDAVDRKDWTTAQTYFDDDVDVDFSSLGGAPGRITGAGLVKNWQDALTNDKQSFHMRGGAMIAVKGDTAVVTSHGYAWTRMTTRPANNDLWEVWGVYEHRLVRKAGGWRIDGLKFVKTYERGDPSIRAPAPQQTARNETPPAPPVTPPARP